MAGNNSFEGLKYFGIVVLVVAASGIIGYYLAGNGQKPPTPPAQVAQTTTNTGLTADQKRNDPNAIIAHGSDYTAPGAPKIEIHEVKPRLTDATHTPKPTVKPVDSEASQEAPPPPPPDTPDTSTDTNTEDTPPAATPDTPDSSANSDPDYESVGTKPDTTSADESSPSGAGGPYRVQVGSFAYSRNAKALADALRSRGYTTTTVVDKSGDKTVYHVQAGAFHSEKAASKATDSLKKDGFPAFTQQP